MPRFGEITIRGLYEADSHIFDNFELASYTEEGETPVVHTIDKDILVNNILDELDEFEVMYPDPDKIKESIKWWSKKLKPNWDLLYKALEEEYDPLHNYNRNEEHNETENATQNVSSSDGSIGSNVTKVSAYDSTDFVNRDKVETNINSTASSNSTNGIIRAYTTKMFGNIGVTTSQQMLEAEMNLRQNYNIYDLIILDFKEKFCLEVY